MCTQKNMKENKAWKAVAEIGGTSIDWYIASTFFFFLVKVLFELNWLSACSLTLCGSPAGSYFSSKKHDCRWIGDAKLFICIRVCMMTCDELTSHLGWTPRVPKTDTGATATMSRMKCSLKMNVYHSSPITISSYFLDFSVDKNEPIIVQWFGFEWARVIFRFSICAVPNMLSRPSPINYWSYNGVPKVLFMLSHKCLIQLKPVFLMYSSDYLIANELIYGI